MAERKENKTIEYLYNQISPFANIGTYEEFYDRCVDPTKIDYTYNKIKEHFNIEKFAPDVESFKTKIEGGYPKVETDASTTATAAASTDTPTTPTNTERKRTGYESSRFKVTDSPFYDDQAHVNRSDAINENMKYHSPKIPVQDKQDPTQWTLVQPGVDEKSGFTKEQLEVDPNSRSFWEGLRDVADYTGGKMLEFGDEGYKAISALGEGIWAGVLDFGEGVMRLMSSAATLNHAYDPLYGTQPIQGVDLEKQYAALDRVRAAEEKGETPDQQDLNTSMFLRAADYLDNKEKEAHARATAGIDKNETFLSLLGKGKIADAIRLGLTTTGESAMYMLSSTNPITAITMVAGQSANNYHELREQYPEMEEWRKVTHAVGDASIEMLIERIHNPFKLLKGGASKEIVEESVKELYEGTSKTVYAKVAKNVLKSTVSEGAEEVAAGVTTDVFNTLVDIGSSEGTGLTNQYKKFREEHPNLSEEDALEQFSEEKGKEYVNQALLGAFGGFVFGSTANIPSMLDNKNSAASNQTADKQSKKTETNAETKQGKEEVVNKIKKMADDLSYDDEVLETSYGENNNPCVIVGGDIVFKDVTNKNGATYKVVDVENTKGNVKLKIKTHDGKSFVEKEVSPSELTNPILVMKKEDFVEMSEAVISAEMNKEEFFKVGTHIYDTKTGKYVGEEKEIKKEAGNSNAYPVQAKTVAVTIDGKKEEVIINSPMLVLNADGSIDFNATKNITIMRADKTFPRGNNKEMYKLAVSDALQKQFQKEEAKKKEAELAEEKAKEAEQIAQQEQAAAEEALQKEKEVIEKERQDILKGIESKADKTTGAIQPKKLSPIEKVIYLNETKGTEVATRMIGGEIISLMEKVDNISNNDSLTEMEQWEELEPLNHLLNSYNNAVVRFLGNDAATAIQSIIASASSSKSATTNTTPVVNEVEDVQVEETVTPEATTDIQDVVEETTGQGTQEVAEETVESETNEEVANKIIKPVNLDADNIEFVKQAHRIRIARRGDDGVLRFLDTNKEVPNTWSKAWSEKVWYNGNAYYMLTKANDKTQLSGNVSIVPAKYRGESPMSVPVSSLNSDASGETKYKETRFDKDKRAAEEKSFDDFVDYKIMDDGFIIENGKLVRKKDITFADFLTTIHQAYSKYNFASKVLGKAKKEGKTLSKDELLDITKYSLGRKRGPLSFFIDLQQGENAATEIKGKIKEAITGWNFFVEHTSNKTTVQENEKTDAYKELQERAGLTSSDLRVQSTDVRKLDSKKVEESPLLQLIVMMDQASEMGKITKYVDTSILEEYSNISNVYSYEYQNIDNLEASVSSLITDITQQDNAGIVDLKQVSSAVDSLRQIKKALNNKLKSVESEGDVKRIEEMIDTIDSAIKKGKDIINKRNEGNEVDEEQIDNVDATEDVVIEEDINEEEIDSTASKVEAATESSSTKKVSNNELVNALKQEREDLLEKIDNEMFNAEEEVRANERIKEIESILNGIGVEFMVENGGPEHMVGQKNTQPLTEAEDLSLAAALQSTNGMVQTVSVEEAQAEYERQKSVNSVRLMLQMLEQGTKGQSSQPISGAKLQKNLESTKQKYQKDGISSENAITDIAKALNAKNTGASNYVTIEAANGQVVTLRISNHNATIANFDNNNENNGISIVISRHANEGMQGNGNAHIVEFFYSDKKLNNSLGTPIADIIESLEQTLYSGEYKDKTGLAQVQEVNAPETDGSAFSIRSKPAPIKTGIGYKVFFRGKDGKLYPPMVANPNGADTPIGVWLDADAAPVASESKTGRPQVKAGGKGTQGGSGSLAYRPGWHLGEIPYALQFNRKDEKGERTLFPKDFVWAEVEYADDVNYQEEAESYGYTESGKYRHSYAGLPRVPENGSYRYRTNPNPQTDPWIITGAMKVNRILTNEEVDDLVRQAGREPQQREFFKNGDVILGYAQDGKIYLTHAGMNANTVIHEYTHIWAKALQQQNPKAWKSIVDTLKKSKELWNEVLNDPNYSSIKNDEDAVASEVLSRYSGKRGAERLEADAKRVIEDKKGMEKGIKVNSLIARVKQALEKFWSWVGKNLFDIKKFDSIEEIADRALYDMLNNTQLNLDNSDRNPTNFDKKFKKMQETLDKEGINVLSLQQISELTDTLEDDLRQGNKPLVFERVPLEALQEMSANERTLAEALTIVAQASRRTSRAVERDSKEVTSDERQSRDGSNRQMEFDLRQYAKEKGIWMEDPISELTELYGEPIGKGQESVVWADENRGVVIKAKSSDMYETLEEFLEGMVLNNILLPQNNQHIVAFGYDNEGLFRVVYETPYVELGENLVSKEEKDSHMESLGFKKIEDNLYTNGVYEVRDLYNQNIVNDSDGNIQLTDAVIKWEAGEHYRQSTPEELKRDEQNEAKLDAWVDNRTEFMVAPSSSKSPKRKKGIVDVSGLDPSDPMTIDYIARARQIEEMIKISKVIYNSETKLPDELNAFAKWITKNYDRTEPIRQLMQSIKDWREKNGLGPMPAGYDIRTQVEAIDSKIKNKCEEADRKELKELSNIVKKWRKKLEKSKFFELSRHEYDNGKRRKLSSLEFLERYLIAMDTIERRNQDKNPRGEEDFKERMGMSVDDFVADFHDVYARNEEGKKMVDELWEKIRAVTDMTLQLGYESGLISEEELNIYKERRFYVPEKDFAEVEAKGDDIQLDTSYVRRGSRNKLAATANKAKGGTTLAANPLTHISYQLYDAIAKSEANKVKISMFNLLRENADWCREYNVPIPHEVWYEKLPNGTVVRRTDAPTAKEREQMRVLKGQVQELVNDMKEYELFLRTAKERLSKEENKDEIANLEEQIKNYKSIITDIENDINSIKSMYPFLDEFDTKAQVYIDKALQNTQTVTLYINGVAQEMNFPNMTEIAMVLNRQNNNISIPLIRQITGTLAAIYTTYDPLFFRVNIARDVPFVLAKGTSEYGLEFSAKFIANLPKVLPITMKAIATGNYSDSTYGKYLKEFFEEGANTGHSMIPQIQKIKKFWKKNRYGKYGGVTYRTLEKIASFMSDWSDVWTRFAAYATVRQMTGDKSNDAIEALSKEKAVSAAKNLSVNFNRKGLGGGFVDAFGQFFAFTNAYVQGASGYIRTFDTSDKKSVPAKAWKFTKAAFIMSAVPAFLGYLSYLLSPDDDEEMYYVSDYERDNYFVWGDLRIPLNEQLKPFWVIGHNIAMAQKGRRNKEQTTNSIISSFIANSLPVPPSISKGGTMLVKGENSLPEVVQAIFNPTILQSVTEMANNTTFMGGKLRYDIGQIPEYMMSNNARAITRDFAEFIYKIGGGDEVIPSKTIIYQDEETGVLKMEELSKRFDVNPKEVEAWTFLFSSGVKDIANFFYVAFSDKHEVSVKDIPGVKGFVRNNDNELMMYLVYKEVKEDVDLYNERLKHYDKTLTGGSLVANTDSENAEKYSAMADKSEEALIALYSDEEMQELSILLDIYKQVDNASMARSLGIFTEEDLAKVLGADAVDQLDEMKYNLFRKLQSYLYKKKGITPTYDIEAEANRAIYGE